MKLLLITTIALLNGCAAWTERGNINTTSIEMPDGSTVKVVDRRVEHLFVPSKSETWTYRRPIGTDDFQQTPNAQYTYQEGMGPGLINTAIEAGATAYTGYAIGKGLEGSGDENNFSNDSASSAKQGQLQGQVQGQIQSQKHGYKKKMKKGKKWGK